MTERDILYKMKMTTTIFLNLLKQIKKTKIEIANDIEYIMDNNYFIEKPAINDQFNVIFDDSAIDNLITLITPFSAEILAERDKLCVAHEYIEDSIDKGLEDSQTIYYCKTCHVSRKNA